MTYRTVRNYIEVLKPRASILLTFIGVCTAIIAGDGQLSLKLLLITLTILLASAGANVLTNYLDCNIDSRMQRTRNRALPSKRIDPPEKILPLNITLVVIGLGLAWYLHPLCFIADVAGTTASVVWRKRSTCVFPQGMIASCAPVLMGWFAIQPVFSWELVLLCVLISAWVPLHVWSVMVAHRQDYVDAGLNFFPVNRQVSQAIKIFMLFTVMLCAAAIGLYFMADFTLIYITVAGVLSGLMVYANIRLVISNTSKNAWLMYKLSSFPYLGLIFLAMCLNIWLH